MPSDRAFLITDAERPKKAPGTHTIGDIRFRRADPAIGKVGEDWILCSCGWRGVCAMFPSHRQSFLKPRGG